MASTEDMNRNNATMMTMTKGANKSCSNTSMRLLHYDDNDKNYHTMDNDFNNGYGNVIIDEDDNTLMLHNDFHNNNYSSKKSSLVTSEEMKNNNNSYSSNNLTWKSLSFKSLNYFTNGHRGMMMTMTPMMR
jgi:hypothetical protein